MHKTGKIILKSESLLQKARETFLTQMANLEKIKEELKKKQVYYEDEGNNNSNIENGKKEKIQEKIQEVMKIIEENMLDEFKKAEIIEEDEELKATLVENEKIKKSLEINNNAMNTVDSLMRLIQLSSLLEDNRENSEIAQLIQAIETNGKSVIEKIKKSGYLE